MYVCVDVLVCISIKLLLLMIRSIIVLGMTFLPLAMAGLPLAATEQDVSRAFLAAVPLLGVTHTINGFEVRIELVIVTDIGHRQGGIRGGGWGQR